MYPNDKPRSRIGEEKKSVGKEKKLEGYVYRKKNIEQCTVFFNISFLPKTIEILIEVKTNVVYSLPYLNSSNIENSIKKNTQRSSFIFVRSFFFCSVFFSFFHFSF